MDRSSKADIIRKWLSEHGYVLELRVGAVLAERGFRVEHGVLFEDPLEGKAREIDLVARSNGAQIVDAGSVAGASVETILVIECKSQVDAWIALTSLSTVAANAGLYPFRSELLEPLLQGQLDATHFFTCLNASTALDPDVIAHAVVSFDSRTVGKPRQDERNVAQFGLASAFNATLALEAQALGADTGQSESSSPIAIFLPVVVIDGQLWECRLEGGREFVLETIPWIVTQVNHGVREEGELQQLLVTVVTEEHLAAYVDVISTDARCLSTALAPLLASLWRTARSRLGQEARARRQTYPRLHRGRTT